MDMYIVTCLALPVLPDVDAEVDGDGCETISIHISPAAPVSKLAAKVKKYYHVSLAAIELPALKLFRIDASNIEEAIIAAQSSELKKLDTSDMLSQVFGNSPPPDKKIHVLVLPRSESLDPWARGDAAETTYP